MNISKHKMEKQVLRFTPSVNILDDLDVSLTYIPTTNATAAFSQIIKDFHTGIHSFNLVGAYGIGKSAFLWAFVQEMTKRKSIFSQGNALHVKGFEVMPLVGEYASFIETFVDRFSLGARKNVRTSDIIKKLDQYYQTLASGGKALIILADEFGKYLEYAAHNTPEKEMYFIQQLAEYVNGSDRNIIFITTLHQDFNGYSRDLTISQQNEWDKVKGRLKEITFNEPVEQLVFLASERLNDLGIGSKPKNFKDLFKLIERSKAFPLRDYFNEPFAEKLIPFDILSIAVLTLSLQKYGQNERSLFSFINSNDHLGLLDFDSHDTPYYNIALVYDYLLHNYYSFLTTKYNPHYTQWSAIRSAIENVEGTSDIDTVGAVKIVKAVGLLNIFAPASIRLDMTFLKGYAEMSLGVKNAEKVIKSLQGLRILRYVTHIHKYILAQSTDLDIELAIDKAGNLVEKVSNVVHYLNQYFDFGYITAKSAFYTKGTPRFFAFHLSESPFSTTPEGEIDGYINLIFSEKLTESEVIAYSASCNEPVLFGWYQNTSEIRKHIFEIEKIKRVREDHIEDRIAVRELDKIKDHYVRLLNYVVMGSMYKSDSPVKWYYAGERIDIVGQKTFNRALSEICSNVYSKTPVYRNELINKTKLSSPIITARRMLISSLIENWHKKDLGFDERKFPPEKTIYLSLLQQTGIHRGDEATGYTLGAPTNEGFQMTPLWDACESFLESTKHGRRNVQELVDVLLSKPFKLKQGFIEVWLVVYLFTRKDDYAMFYENAYVPNFTSQTIDLLLKDPKAYAVKMFNIDGVNLDVFNSYRTLLNQSQLDQPGLQSFVDTIKPFLSFYRGLPNYAKYTNQLKKETIALRHAIAFAKDPEDVFFNEFPKAMGYRIPDMKDNPALLETYSDHLQAAIREIRSSYDGLIQRVEEFIKSDITGQGDYPDYKTVLQARYKNIKKHLLLNHHKVFLQRLGSETDDNKAWLNSIAQACIDKPLESINDTDEAVFYDRFKDIVHELDNLNEISASGFDETKEIAFRLEVTSFVEGLQKNLVRLPKSKNKDLVQLQSVIKTKLSQDRQLNIATLAKLLEEILANEKTS